jgi:hypothetical protein
MVRGERWYKMLSKKDIYDKVCGILTDYENAGQEGHENGASANDLYETLVEVQDYLSQNDV